MAQDIVVRIVFSEIESVEGCERGPAFEGTVIEAGPKRCEECREPFLPRHEVGALAGHHQHARAGEIHHAREGLINACPIEILLVVEVDEHVHVLVDDGVVEIGHHSCHPEAYAVVPHDGAPERIVGAEELAGKPLRDHRSLSVFQASLPVSLKEGEVEEVEKGGVGHQHLGCDELIVVGYVYPVQGETARALYLGIVLAQMSGHGVVCAVGAIRPLGVKICAHQVDAVGFGVLSVDVGLLPHVEPDEHDKHQSHRQPEHVDGRVDLVP